MRDERRGSGTVDSLGGASDYLQRNEQGQTWTVAPDQQPDAQEQNTSHTVSCGDEQAPVDTVSEYASKGQEDEERNYSRPEDDSNVGSGPARRCQYRERECNRQQFIANYRRVAPNQQETQTGHFLKPPLSGRLQEPPIVPSTWQRLRYQYIGPTVLPQLEPAQTPLGCKCQAASAIFLRSVSIRWLQAVVSS